MTEPFGFTGLTGRRPGPLVRTASALLPGVRAVQRQVEPYAAAWREHNIAALALDGPLWVALGDSMTQGVGASAYDRGWVGQLAQRLAADGGPSRVVNLSQYGARIRDVLDAQLPALRALDAEPALVTLLIGSNDLFRRAGRDVVLDDYARLLARVPAGTVVANLPQDQGLAAQMNALMNRAVERRGLVLADTHQRRTQSWHGKLAADRFHPNDLGYADIAAVFGAAVDGARRSSGR